MRISDWSSDVCSSDLPGLEHAAKLGYRRIVVFPYFLFTGILVKRIYEHTDRVAARYPGIEFVKAPYLNDHPLVFDTFADRVREILRSEEHTSELQSLMRISYAVFCLKKKQLTTQTKKEQN